jgi:hypothetical protein
MTMIDVKLNPKGRLLKEARLQLLKLHKLLVDNERVAYERSYGQVTSGHFLNILINDKDFKWLKRFSSLIVEIDKMFDLDDGASVNMLENQLLQMKDLLELNNSDDEFRSKYNKALQNNPEIQGKHQKLKKILSEK